MIINLLSLAVGFLLGASLVTAGFRKVLRPEGLNATLAQLFGRRSTMWPIRALAASLPWVEIAVGGSACAFPNQMLVRICVFVLFSTFLAVVSLLAIRFETFDCGCFGSDGAERREIILARATAAFGASIVLLLSRSEMALTIQEDLWVQCAGWSVLLLIATARHAKEFLSASVD